MRSFDNYFALFLLLFSLAAPGTGFAGDYVWYDSLESSLTDGYKDVLDLTTHEDMIYAAARTVLVKYSADGQELWRREAVTMSGAQIFLVATDAEGVYVAGSAQNENGYSFGLVQKFDHDGNLLWTNIDADPEGGSEIWGLAVTDTGVYTSGYRYPEGGVVRRLTPDGDIVWVRLLGAGTSSGGLVVTNVALYVAWGDRILVYDTAGDYLTDFGVPLYVRGLVLHDDHLYLTGNELSRGYESLVRVDLEGNVAWQRTLTEYWPVGGLTVTDTGILIAALRIPPRNREPSSGLVLHFDFHGNERELWSHTGDVIQPGPITANANGIYLGGIEAGIPVYPGFVAQLKVQPRYWKLATLADANGNGTPELAALRTLPDGTAEVIVKDPVTNQFVRRLPFALPGALEIDVAGVLDMNGNGTAEAAVLFRKRNGQGIVQIRDAGTGEWITQMAFFGAKWEVKALASLDLDGDQVSELGVVAQTDDLQSAGVQIRNSVTKAQKNWIGLPAPNGETVLDLTSVEDANGNGSPEVAALYRDVYSGVARFIVADGASKRQISELVSVQPPFPQPERKALALTGMIGPDLGSGPGLAVLFDKPNGQGVAALSSAAAGGWTEKIFFAGKEWAVRDIASHDLDGDGISELSVLVEADDGSASGVQIKDSSTGNQVKWIGLPLN